MVHRRLQRREALGNLRISRALPTGGPRSRSLASKVARFPTPPSQRLEEGVGNRAQGGGGWGEGHRWVKGGGKQWRSEEWMLGG